VPAPRASPTPWPLRPSSVARGRRRPTSCPGAPPGPPLPAAPAPPPRPSRPAAPLRALPPVPLHTR
jgi:hypothetical protein